MRTIGPFLLVADGLCGLRLTASEWVVTYFTTEVMELAERRNKKKSGCRLEVESSGPSLGKLLRGLVCYASGGEAARAA